MLHFTPIYVYEYFVLMYVPGPRIKKKDLTIYVDKQVDFLVEELIFFARKKRVYLLKCNLK